MRLIWEIDANLCEFGPSYLRVDNTSAIIAPIVGVGGGWVCVGVCGGHKIAPLIKPSFRPSVRPSNCDISAYLRTICKLNPNLMALFIMELHWYDLFSVIIYWLPEVRCICWLKLINFSHHKNMTMNNKKKREETTIFTLLNNLMQKDSIKFNRHYMHNWDINDMKPIW